MSIKRIIQYGWYPQQQGAGILAANPPKYAYGLVKIHPNATIAGTCVRSDGATQTIGFVGNDLDTAAIALFCGALEGGFYMAEQSGTGLDVAVDSFSQAPRIYNGSAVTTDPTNGKPALLFNASSRHNINTQSLFNFLHNGTKSLLLAQISPGLVANPNDAYTIFGNNGNTAGQTGIVVLYDDRSGVGFNNAFGGSVSRASTGFVASQRPNNVLSPASPHLVSVFLDVSNPALSDRWLQANDGGALVGLNTASGTAVLTDATQDAQIGGTGGNSSFISFIGYYQHIIFYDTDQLANKSAIETPLINYYA